MSAEWEELFFRLVVALARPSLAPEGTAHLAAQLTDAALHERDRRAEKEKETKPQTQTCIAVDMSLACSALGRGLFISAGVHAA